MPINRKMMNSLKKEYGKDAEKVYYALENKKRKKKKRNALGV